MNNNPDLPEGWSMPPAMAKRVSESINKKPTTPDGNLQNALEEMARDIAIIEPNPKDWGWWVSYLLEQLETEAGRGRKSSDYASMMQHLICDIQHFTRKMSRIV